MRTQVGATGWRSSWRPAGRIRSASRPPSRGQPLLGDFQYGSTLPFGPQYEDLRLRAIALHARSLPSGIPARGSDSATRRCLSSGRGREYWPPPACGFASAPSICEAASGVGSRLDAKTNRDRFSPDLDRVWVLAAERSAREHVEDDRLRRDCGARRASLWQETRPACRRGDSWIFTTRRRGAEIPAVGFAASRTWVSSPTHWRSCSPGDLYLLRLRDHAGSRPRL